MNVDPQTVIPQSGEPTGSAHPAAERCIQGKAPKEASNSDSFLRTNHSPSSMKRSFVDKLSKLQANSEHREAKLLAQAELTKPKQLSLQVESNFLNPEKLSKRRTFVRIRILRRRREKVLEHPGGKESADTDLPRPRETPRSCTNKLLPRQPRLNQSWGKAHLPLQSFHSVTDH